MNGRANKKDGFMKKVLAPKGAVVMGRFLGIAAPVLAAGLLLLSCGKKPEDRAVSSAAPGERLAAAQELTLLVDNRFWTLDPQSSKMIHEWLIINHINEGLFRVVTGEDGLEKLDLAGAESYTVSEDGLVYTFKLRDHTWEDGQPVTAQQYVDAIIRLLTPEYAYSYAFLLEDIKNAGAFIKKEVAADALGVRAVDNKTLEITLEAVTPYFLSKLGIPVYFPVRLDIVGTNTDQSWGSSAERTFSNGPFKVASWERGNNIVLVKNPAYWDAANVKLERVNLRVVDEDSTRAQLFNNRQLDVVSGAADYFETWKNQAGSGNIVLVERFGGRTVRIDLAFGGGVSGLADNKKIRQALSLAINRRELVDLAFNGLQVPAYGLLPQGLSLDGKAVRELIPEPLTELSARYVKDAEALRSLFREGLKEENHPGGPETVTLEVVTYETVQAQKVLQEYLKQTWEEKLGIHINIEIITDEGLLYSKIMGGQFDLSISNNITTDYNDPLNWLSLWYWPRGASAYFGGYKSPEYDALYDTLRGVTDVRERAAIYGAVEKQLIAVDWQVIPLYYGQLEYFVQPYVKGLYFPSLSTPYEFSRAYILEH
jgi:ABC-type oligopeptide transport system substrate-binding subunit